MARGSAFEFLTHALGTQPFWYFQLWYLPSAIQSTAVARCWTRASSRFASSSHSTYSRRWVGLNASNAASAPFYRRRAARKYSGVCNTGRGIRFVGWVTFWLEVLS